MQKAKPSFQKGFNFTIDKNVDKDNSNVVVNLKNINMPFLNVVAERDDLVAPESSKALNDALTESHDKNLIEFKSGHVGLMIGKHAHKELTQGRIMDKEPVVN